MKRALLSMMNALLAACAAAPAPPGAQVDQARLLAAAVPGQATREGVRAAFGPAQVQRFDSGIEVWLYRAPAPGGSAELVLQFDRAGTLRKLRRRPPHPFDEARPAP